MWFPRRRISASRWPSIRMIRRFRCTGCRAWYRPPRISTRFWQATTRARMGLPSAWDRWGREKTMTWRRWRARAPRGFTSCICGRCAGNRIAPSTNPSTSPEAPTWLASFVSCSKRSCAADRRAAQTGRSPCVLITATCSETTRRNQATPATPLSDGSRVWRNYGEPSEDCSTRCRNCAIPQRNEVTVMGELDGKAALVTGTTGIGRAIAVRFAEAGARVVAGGIDEQANQELSSIAAQKQIPLLVERCDVADPASVRALVDAAVGRLGGIDILVNAAAIHPFGNVLETDV